jgi:UDP-N-acetylmuramate: L-alanyl-gamma-D-glutamyl-meso-diaminopimelate ligase
VPLDGAASTFKITDAPLIIIQEKEKPSASTLDYHHHIAVISDVGPGDEAVFTQFADATPKGGVLIYSDAGPAAEIGKKERLDTSAIAFPTYAHVTENGQVILITGKNARVPIKLNGDAELRSLSAAREILKKTGITSDQFYRAIAGFEG